MYLEMITSCLYNLIYYVCQLSFLGQSVFKLIIVNFSLNLWMNLWRQDNRTSNKMKPSWSSKLNRQFILSKSELNNYNLFVAKPSIQITGYKIAKTKYTQMYFHLANDDNLRVSNDY